MRRPSRRITRAFTSLTRDALELIGQRSTAFEATLLTFCPPGPELRTKEKRISLRGIAICELIWTSGETVMQANAEPRPGLSFRTQPAIAPKESNNRKFQYPDPLASHHTRLC